MKRTMCFLIAFIILLQIPMRCLNAQECESKINVVCQMASNYSPKKESFIIASERRLQAVGCEQSFYTLYEFSPYGYMIFYGDSLIVMEAAFTNDSRDPFYTAENESKDSFYYGGPGHYFYLKDSVLFEIGSNTIVDNKKQLAISNKMSHTDAVLKESIINSSNGHSPKVGVLTTMIESDYFMDLINQFGDNTSNTCTTVATCILLGYYDVFVDDSFVSYLFRDGIGTTQGFHDYMAYNYIDPDYNGAFISAAATGMNNYFNTINLDATATCVTGPNPTGPAQTVSTVIASISNGYPLIANMNKNVLGAPYDHSVVVYGVAINAYNPPATQVCFIVHMGWRNSSASMRQLYCSSLWFWDSSYITFDGENEID